MENYEVKETRVIVGEVPPNRWRIAVITGGIGGVIICILQHITRVMAGDDVEKMENAGIMGWLPYIVVLGTLIWAITWHKKQWMETEYPFGAGFKTGLSASLIIGAVVALYTYVMTHLLLRDTEKLTRIKEQIAASMEEKNPNITDEQLAMNMRFVDWFFNPIVAALGSLLLYFLIGLLCSMVVSIFTQTRNRQA